MTEATVGDQLSALEQQVAALSQLVQNLRQEIQALKNTPNTDLANFSHTENNNPAFTNQNVMSNEILDDKAMSSSRRRMLRKLGGLAAGLAVAGAIAGTNNEAEAASGDALRLGNTNIPSSNTDITRLKSPTNFMPAVFRVDNIGQLNPLDIPVPQRTAVGIMATITGSNDTYLPSDKIAVLGATDFGVAVAGNCTGVSDGTGVRGTSTNGVGVAGYSDNGSGVTGSGKYGGSFSGSMAALRLWPGAEAGPPPTDKHEVGELYVDSDGVLYYLGGKGWQALSGNKRF